MAKSSNNPYGSMGSVPYDPAAAPTELGTPNRNIHASGEDFGAQIGAGISKIGETGEQIADQYGKMVNESLMTQADVDFATKLGQLKADYTSKSGLAAYNAFPEYQKAVAQAFQESRANLPLGAQHGFDMLGARTMANHIADGSSFATSQLKEQTRYDGSSMTNVNMKAIAQIPPSDLVKPDRTEEHIGHALYGLQMQMDENHPGLKQNENGEFTFDESKPEGQGLKAEYEANKNSIITQGQSTRFDTLAKSDPLGAYSIYQNERDGFPKQTQITLDQKFEPIVFNAHKDNAVGHTIAQSQDDYSKMLYNPQKTPLDVIRENEGYTGKAGKDSNGYNVLNGINEQSFPKEYAEAKNILDTKGKAAADEYADNFYQKNIIDKYAIKSLPANTQTIVADGLVNHGGGAFGQSLIQAAKDGKSPQELIDMRRGEYQRLADSDTDGSKGYASSLNGWNKRLDKFQTTDSQPKKSYATNPDGSMLQPADYYRTHGEDVLAKGDDYAERTMPGDLAFKRAVRENLTNYMTKVKADDAGQKILDNRNVMRGIIGEFTKGAPPMTEQELQAIPGMGGPNGLLAKVYAQDPKFAETIPTLISKSARRNDVTNSPNAFETITRTLQPQDESHPNHIKNQTQLDSLLGKNDGTGINMKDYNDAKPATELPSETKEILLKKMQDISSANGNVDGKGQQRATQWYNQAMTAIKKNDALGDKKEPDLDKLLPPAQMPSRMGQLSDLVAARAREKAAMTFTSPDDPEFAKLPSGTPFKDADGKMWTKK